MIRQIIQTVAGRDRPSPLESIDDRIDLGPLLRIAAWGVTAAGALAIAVFVSRSETGERRVAMATTNSPAQTEAMRMATVQALSRAEEAEREARRLAETVRTLTADRDKLATRVGSLERSLEDLTGSIALTPPARRPAMADMLLLQPSGQAPQPRQQDHPPLHTGSLPEMASLTPTPSASQPFIEPVRPGRVPPMPPPVTEQGPGGTDTALFEIPLPRPKPPIASLHAHPDTPGAQPPAPALREIASRDPAITDTGDKQRFGIDLGSATSVEGLRTLWSRIREGQSSSLLGELKPLVAVHDAAQPGSVELRLIAGPVPSALAASRLCAALATTGTPCRAAPFEGQSLATR
jgi:hypothetical protein